MDIQAAVPVKLEHGARMDLATFEMLIEQIPGKWPRYELIEGRVVEVPSPKPIHNKAASLLGHYLDAFLIPLGLPLVYTEADLKPLGETGSSYITPDLAYFSDERFPDFDDNAYPLSAPDIAVEIVSPSNSEEDLAAKIKLYLQGGSRLIWIMYPQREEIWVYRPDKTYTIFEGDGVLDGGDVLPGFTLNLSEFWTVLKRKNRKTE